MVAVVDFFKVHNFFTFFSSGGEWTFSFLSRYYVFFSLCCSNSLKAISFSLDSSFYLDNLEITLIKAPFSSLNRWLSFFRCSSCWKCKKKNVNFHNFFFMKKKIIQTILFYHAVINYRIGWDKITWYLQNNKAHEGSICSIMIMSRLFSKISK